jgi:transposase-like protein
VKHATRSAYFKWRHPAPELIPCAVRWYVHYSLSFYDVEELLAERGLEADHTTIWRWFNVKSRTGTTAAPSSQAVFTNVFQLVTGVSLAF